MRLMRQVTAALCLSVALAIGGLIAPHPAAAASALTIDVITWNVIGLDSNDVTAGPATYPVGVRICNTGADPATDTTAAFTWTTSSPAIELVDPASTTVGTIAPSSCRDVYWNVDVVRAASSYGASRGYVVTATAADGATASTPSPRELFVERLISQNRNSVNSITGPTAVTVGDEVTFTVDASTATNGYEQLEAFLTLPGSIFQLLSTSVTYGAPPGATNDTMYADACGWDDVPTSPTYQTCIGPEGYPGGKAGGDLLTTYTVRVIGTGTATLTSAIYDKSGSSYHYNSDFGVAPNLLVVTASAPVPTTVTTVAPAPTTTLPSPPATTATASAGRSPARSGSPGGLAATGRSDTQPLALLGLALLALGSASLLSSRIGEGTVVASPLERSVHRLRAALYDHERNPVTPLAWEMLDALDRLSRQLRDIDSA